MQLENNQLQKSLQLVKLRNKQKISKLSNSFSIRKENNSDFQEMNLAEFSSLYNFSSILENLEEIKEEVQHMKDSKNKSLIQAYIKEKMHSASKYLSEAKSRLKEEAIYKYRFDKSHSINGSPRLPSVAKEVVKRCSQPHGYFLFRKQTDFIPKALPKAKKQLPQPPEVAVEIKEMKKSVAPRKKLMSQRQVISESELSFQFQLSQQDQSKVDIQEQIINNPQGSQQLKLPSLYQRSISVGKQLITNRTRHTTLKEPDSLLGQVMDQFAAKASKSDLSQKDLLIQIVKLVAIERNLNEDELRELLLSSIRELYEMELSDLAKPRFFYEFQSASLSQSPTSSRVDIVSDKLERLQKFYRDTVTLLAMQKELKLHNKSIKKEQSWIHEWFKELENYYQMINEGDMPAHDDAQILFEARKIEQIWDYREQYLIIQKFKQLSNASGANNGMLTLQRYEHNKFVKESQKRRLEMKQMS